MSWRDKASIENLLANATPIPEAGCYLWLGGWNNHGYGIRSKRAVHRQAWEAVHGPIADGLCVCHTCDTRSCINPAHLFLANHADNMADMAKKGRAAGGNRKPIDPNWPTQHFLDNYTTVPESGCWLWLGSWSADGYGYLNRFKRFYALAHRFIYEIRVGAIPDGHVLVHKCGARACVNPDHMELKADPARAGKRMARAAIAAMQAGEAGSV